MNSTGDNETRTGKSFITPAGAILALLCFFLPWVKFSCAGSTQIVSGMKLAQDEGLLWLVFIAALVILGVYFYMRSKNTVWKSKRYTLIGCGVAVLVIVYEFIDFLTGVDTEFGRIKPSDVGFTLQFGFFGTLLGFILAAVGAYMLPKGPPEEQAERLSEADGTVAKTFVAHEEMADILSVLQRWFQSVKQWFRSFDWRELGERVEEASVPEEEPEELDKVEIEEEGVQEEVRIAESNLQEVIRNTLGKHEGPIFKSELEGLNELDARNKGINNLNGVESCSSLQTLWLQGNQIRDVSPLSNSTNLQYLYLSYNRVTEISPLSNLTKLQRLWLQNNQIDDISPLSGLTDLQEVNLRSNQIRDISPLVSNSGLGEGDKIDLRENPLNDEAYEIHIPALQDRGVEVLFDPKSGAQAERLPETDVTVAEPIIISEEAAETPSVLQGPPQPPRQRARSFDWRETGKRIGGQIMNSTKSSGFVQVITPIIKLAIGLVALLIIRYIVSVIPMIKDAEITQIPVTSLQIIHAVIDTIILIVLLNFGREFKKGAQLALPNFREAGVAANLVVILIVICLAYTVYDDIVDAFTRGNYNWIYPVVLLCIALVPLYLLGVTLYKNIDKFTGRIVGKFGADAKEGDACPHCKAPISPDTKFCANCGQEVAKAEAEPSACSNCGATIEGDAKFCRECGTPLEQALEVAEATEEQEG